MTSTAVAQVFVLPQVLETILLHLDAKRLFAVRRVSQDFQNTSAGSKKNYSATYSFSLSLSRRTVTYIRH